MPPHLHLHVDEFTSSFPQSISHSTQLDLPITPADPAAQIPPPNITGFDNYDFMFPDDLGSLLDSIEFDAPAEAPEDGRHPCSTDADMFGVNAAAAAPQAAHPVHLCGGGHGHGAVPCCATRTAEIQHLGLEEIDAQWRLHSLEHSGVELQQEQRLFAEGEPSTAPDEKLAPAPEDGGPFCRDADMAEVNAAATQPGAGPLPDAVGGGDAEYQLSLRDEESIRMCDAFTAAMSQDLSRDGIQLDPKPYYKLYFERMDGAGDGTVNVKVDLVDSRTGEIVEPGPCNVSIVELSIVEFTGPNSKSRKPHQPRQTAGWLWKETGTKGLRAVADRSSPQPPGQQEQQPYVALKKTLELDDDGNGNKWLAREYTPLLPSDDGTNKLLPAEFSMRFEFKKDKRKDEPLPSAAVASTKRKEDEPPPEPGESTKRPKIAPSEVWEHMTKVHVKAAATSDKDGTQRKKKPCYRVKYAICHHCDKLLNAESKNGTNNLSTHLKKCNHCECTHSHSAAPCGTDADMLGAAAAAATQAAPAVPVCGGGHAAAPCCAAGTAEIQHLREKGAQGRLRHSWKQSDFEQEQRLFAQPGPFPVAVGGGDACGAAIKHVMVEDKLSGQSFEVAILLDLHGKEHTAAAAARLREPLLVYTKVLQDSKIENLILDNSILEPSWSIVPFTGPKGRKPMAGMRTVADPSSPQPARQQEQQPYVALKKTLELDDDGNGNKLRAHEYTPLLPSDDGTSKLVPAEFSLRVQFKEDKPLSPLKRKEDEQPAFKDTKRLKIAPKKSPAWNHMTPVHVKVAATNNKDGTQRKKNNPHSQYKVMYAICHHHHCNRVFNADSEHHGTTNLKKHLDNCPDCNCGTYSQSR